MTTSTFDTTPSTTDTYRIVTSISGAGFYVERNSVFLTDRNGHARLFATRSSARKAITRDRRPAGDRSR